MGKTKDLGHLAHIVSYDAENHITVPAGITMHTNQLVASQAWVTTELGSYALSSSLGSYVPTSRTITINGTVYDLSENREWNITSMIYPSAGIPLSTGTAWGTSITNNSANWNTAYGWGNHASAGYLTGITSTQVTTALGYTPYNGTTNPNGYITGISFANVSAKPTTLSGYGITDAVPSSRTITINGTAFDLSTNRSWTVSASDATKLPLSGGTMTGKIYTVSTGTGTYETAIEIRETSYVTTSQSAWGYSPALTFHWGGRYAKRFGMRSDGLFAVDDEPLALRSWVTSQGYITGSYLPLSGGTVTGDIVYSNLKFSGDQTYGLIGRNAYVDTINGRGSDPLEINYYDGGHVIIGTGSTGSKALYAGSLYDSGNRVITTSSIGSQSVSYASSANYANHLPTHYVGGAQGNPQVYFNNGIGLKAAMTGAWSVWSDTLWVNGYSGGDVPWMCALHFLRNSEPRFAISAQTHTGTGYGSYYEVITAYNIASQTVANLSGFNKSEPTFSNVYNTGWFRNYADSGLYNQDYGCHLRRNTSSSHGAWEIFGYTKAGYIGMNLRDPQTYNNNLMYENGNGGMYTENANGWQWYYNRGSNCLGLGGSTTYNWVRAVVNGKLKIESDSIHTGWAYFDNNLQLAGGGNTLYNEYNYWYVWRNWGGWGGEWINRNGGDMIMNLYAVYSVTGSISDIRYKKDVTSLPYGLNEIMQLNPIKYHYNLPKESMLANDPDYFLGFSAQEVQSLIPEAVHEKMGSDNKDGMLAITYDEIIPVLVNGIKEQQVMIHNQNIKINKLETLVNQLLNN